MIEGEFKMNCIEMRLRPSGDIVQVYDITDGMATIFNKAQFMTSDQGWQKIKVSKLVPMEFELHNTDTVSQTTKNKAKKRMHLEDATWKTSDGELWRHENIDDAIAHELELMEKEKNKGEEE